ncbi:DUF6894 family protein [Microvirga aerophila]|nr:hypothetical protein [Microvirga aerophila]
MLLMPSRYYFNLTDGDEVIRDDDGIETPDLRTALSTPLRRLSS